MKYFFLILFASANAMACLPTPLEWRFDLKNMMVAEVLTENRVSIEDLSSAQVTDLKVLKYEWIKTNSGFQCHDKETVSAKVAVSFIEKGSLCVVKSEVQLVNSRYDGAPAPEFIIKSEPKDCLSQIL
jgi:hypothetical protein